MTQLNLKFLDTFEVALNGRSLTGFESNKVRALLVYLVMSNDWPHGRHELAGLLWPDYPDVVARKNLRQALNNLRNTLDDQHASPSFLLITAESIQWNPNSSCCLDVAAFGTLLLACDNHPHRHAERCHTCARNRRQAAELYRGDFLAHFYLEDSVPFEEWALLQREKLRRRALLALQHLVTYHEQHNQPQQAQTYAARQLELDPWHEEAHRQLMRAFALDGNRSAVLRQYETFRQLLAAELGVEPEQETTRLFAAIKSGEWTPKQTVSNEPLGNLPVSLTPFVGRERELAELVDNLENPNCRLVTLAGLGGVGKTRLAAQAALQAASAYADGVCLVPLAPLQSAEFIVPAIAQALAFSFAGQTDPKEQLLNYLRAKDILLVLDNLEHLLPEVAALLLEILQNAKWVTLLVTSRMHLNMLGEWVYELEGLDYPRPDEVVANDAANYSAVTLFLLHARRVGGASFQVLEEERTAIAAICRLVEGMPLAIELAATWVRTLSYEAIAKEIEQGLSLLTTSMMDMPERHRSVQAVFEHSWRLLSTAERCVFRQLSVFQGGFRREAAEQVVRVSLDGLSDLVDKSLLRHASGRYELHELLRQYAAAKLQEVPQEQEAVQDRHSSFYIDYLWRQTEPLISGQQRQAVAEVKPEIDNIRLAWERAVRYRKFVEIRRAVAGWSNFYDILGWYHEAESVCRRTIEILEKEWSDKAAERHRSELEKRERDIVLGQMLAMRGGAFFRLGLFSQSKNPLQQSLVLLNRLEARGELSIALFYFGSVAISLGEFTEAQAILQEGLAINQECEDRRGIALCLSALGIVAHFLGEYEQAVYLIRQSLELMRAVGDQHYLALNLGLLAGVVSALGELSEAKHLLRESLVISRALDDRWALAFGLRQLGLVTHLLGNTEWVEAKRLYQESLAISTELGDRANMAVSLNLLGQSAYALGERQESKQYFLTAFQVAMEAQIAPLALDNMVDLVFLLVKGLTGITESEVDIKEKALELLTLVSSHPASRKEAKDRAIGFAAELASELSAQAVADAQARGQISTLEDVANDILTRKWDHL